MQQLSIAGIDQTRADLDQYFTPSWLAERMVAWGIEAWKAGHPGRDYHPPMILEPCAGQGSIVRAALDSGALVVAFEIDSDHMRLMGSRFRQEIEDCRLFLHGGDFLDHPSAIYCGADLAVTNPPYRWDRVFMRHIMRCCPMAITLLRTVCLNGVGNWEALWSENHLRRVAHLKRRPRFGGAFQPKIDFSVYDIGPRPRGMSSDQPHTVQVSWW